MIKFENISKSYSGKHGSFLKVLTGVNATVPDGNFTAVTGASGCGKSTLLLLAGGLLHPDAGSVKVCNEDLLSLSPDQSASRRAQLIGFVFQRFHLLPYLTVEENIKSASVALPASQRQPDERAYELMEQLRLTDRRGHLPSKLSVGEMQRTGVARALFNKPQVLLADEPTGNIDPDNAEIVLNTFTDFARAGGTVLMVTHRNDDVARADNLWHLQDGELQEV